MIIKYLLETQEIICLGGISRSYIGLTERFGEDRAFPQRSVLNGSRKEGRGADLLPQVKTGSRQQREPKPITTTYVVRFQLF